MANPFIFKKRKFTPYLHPFFPIPRPLIHKAILIPLHGEIFLRSDYCVGYSFEPKGLSVAPKTLANFLERKTQLYEQGADARRDSCSASVPPVPKYAIPWYLPDS